MANNNTSNSITPITTPRRFRGLPFVVCSLATLFYVYEFFLRVMPSAMTYELMHDFHVNAAWFGMMTALFYWSYTPMQIPAGLMYDRFGPRIILTVSTAVCALSALAFGITTNILTASIARFLIGFFSSFGFLGALVLAARWYDAKYFAFIAGLVQFMGCVGAIIGQAPIAVIVKHIGWRATMLDSAIVGFVIAVLIWIYVKDYPEQTNNMQAPKNKSPHEISKLKVVLANRQMWWVAIYAFSTWAPITIFAELWGVPYLALKQQTSVAVAASGTSIVWIGIAIGSPLFGWWSNKIGNRRKPMLICSGIGLITALLLLFLPQVPLAFMWCILFLFGVAASGQILSFGVVQDITPSFVAGTAVGFNNMAVVAGGIILQPLIGFVLQLLWNGEVANGVHVYSLSNYEIALFSLPLLSLLGIIMTIFYVKETHCKSIY